jgi:hypothetical protein
MGYGKWTRWGRGSCEGYSLQIGDALRGQVVRRHDGRWGATLNTTDLGEHRQRAEAQAAVEQRIDSEMSKISEDWAIWQGQAEGKASGPRLAPLRRDPVLPAPLLCLVGLAPGIFGRLEIGAPIGDSCARQPLDRLVERQPIPDLLRTPPTGVGHTVPTLARNAPTECPT